MTEFEQIYRAYFQDVYRYLRSLTRDDSLAEELTSQTFFKALEALDSFRGGCDLRVWLCQIAKNTYYTYLRKHRRLTPLTDAEQASQPGDWEDQLTDREAALEIYAALHSLPEPYKEVFLLRALGELSFAQIGALFQRTENWACVTYHRAKQKIQDQTHGSQKG